MKKTVIITDGASSLPESLIKDLPIIVLPMSMVWDNEILVEGEDITPEDFYPRLSASDTIPVTSQLTIQGFKTVFEEEVSKGNAVLAVLLSSGVSGTISSALTAAQEFSSEEVQVIDSEQLSMGSGWMALRAARKAAEGGSLKECAAIVNDQIKNTMSYMCVDTLEYLHKGGRISHSKNLVGSLLNMKPILIMENKKLQPLESIRTSKKAHKRAIELVKEYCEGKTVKYLGIQHTNAYDKAKELSDELITAINPEETVITYLSAILGVHSGPGCIVFNVVVE